MMVVLLRSRNWTLLTVVIHSKTEPRSYHASVRVRLFDRRPLTALQVEVTSRCTRQCAICPRSALASAWRDGDLADTTWDRLREDLGLARHVHLQGWGEPLLHPRLPEMVDEVKAAGSDVGITTNGDLLEPAIDWIVEKRVDQVVLSVAGDDATHAELRSGARLDETWTVLRRLIHRRGKKKTPKVKVSYLLTRRNCEQIPGIVEAAADVGADEIFVIHLDCTPSRELRDEAAFGASGLIPEAAVAIDRATRLARTRKITFRAPSISRQDILVCALDPPSVVFVGWNGRVGPCVYLGLPVDGPIPRWDENGATTVEPMVYGDLAEGGLAQILRGERFRSFAGAFDARRAIERRFVDGMIGRSTRENLDYLDDADRVRERDLAAHPFPGPCAGCHKVVGW
jgi:MoaA/NifB/PqqE/SkfB family radical SAM enzyme